MCQGCKLHSFYIGMNVCGSAYENGCVVNGTCAMATDCVLILSQEDVDGSVVHYKLTPLKFDVSSETIAFDRNLTVSWDIPVDEATNQDWIGRMGM